MCRVVGTWGKSSSVSQPLKTRYSIRSWKILSPWSIVYLHTSDSFTPDLWKFFNNFSCKFLPASAAFTLHIRAASEERDYVSRSETRILSLKLHMLTSESSGLRSCCGKQQRRSLINIFHRWATRSDQEHAQRTQQICISSRMKPQKIAFIVQS